LEWWERRRSSFELYISEFVLTELGLGDSEAAQRRLEAVAGIAELEATEAVRNLGKALIQEGAIPSKAEIDAYHCDLCGKWYGIPTYMELHAYCQCGHAIEDRNSVPRAGI
jgi:hypothetical protein